MSRSRQPSWSPSRRELRKYATIFLKADADRDGFVEAGEAYSLCERSGLDEYVLAQAWMHADRDQDGRLNFHEFVALVHIVTCCVRGLECPPESALPQELEAALYALVESPEELQAQRSRSSSRSGSESPLYPSMSPPIGSAGSLPSTASEGWWQQPVGHAPTTGSESWQPSGNYNSEEPGGSRTDKRKKRHKEKGGVGSPIDFDKSRQMNGHTIDADEESSRGSPRFGSQSTLDIMQRERDVAADVVEVKKHLRAVLEADRIVLRRAQKDADKMQDELQRTQDAHKQLHLQIRRDRQDSETKLAVQQQLQRQVLDARSRLEAVREERKAMNVDSVSFWRDRDHYTQELAFLKSTAEEEGMMLDHLRSANSYLERCQKAYLEQAAQLEHQRKELAEFIACEERLMQRDELQNEEARAQLERMRREIGDSKGVTTEEVDLMRLRRQSDGLRSTASSSAGASGAGMGARHLAAADTDSRSVHSQRSGRSAAETSSHHSQSAARQSERQPAVLRPSDAHSWASSLVGSTFGLPASVVGSAQDPRSREGV